MLAVSRDTSSLLSTTCERKRCMYGRGGELYLIYTIFNTVIQYINEFIPGMFEGHDIGTGTCSVCKLSIATALSCKIHNERWPHVKNTLYLPNMACIQTAFSIRAVLDDVRCWLCLDTVLKLRKMRVLKLPSYSLVPYLSYSTVFDAGRV